LSPEAETELKILGFILFECQSPVVREQQIVKPMGYGIIEKRRDAEKPLRN
jgi:hypothetical protein